MSSAGYASAAAPPSSPGSATQAVSRTADAAARTGRDDRGCLMHTSTGCTRTGTPGWAPSSGAWCAVPRLSSGAANRHEPVTTTTACRRRGRAAPRAACRVGGGCAGEYRGVTRTPSTDEWGIDATWLDALDEEHQVAEATIERLREVIGTAPADLEDRAPIVARPGDALEVDEAEVTLEDGSSRHVDGELPEDFPLGYHWLQAPGGPRRRFRNPVYLRVEEVPGADGVDLDGESGRSLNDGELIDRDAIWARKREALRRVFG